MQRRASIWGLAMLAERLPYKAMNSSTAQTDEFPLKAILVKLKGCQATQP